MMKLLLLLAAAVPLFAQNCTYSVTQPAGQSVNVGADPSNNSLTVAAPPACAWFYSSNVPWITFAGQSHGSSTGNGTITWSAAANPTPVQRQGSIAISNLSTSTILTVIQAAAICTLVLAPLSANVVVGTSTGSFQVQTNCTWSAAPAQSWIALTSAASGSLNGSLGYIVAANACQPSRSGAIAVQAGGGPPVQQFSIRQDGAAGNLALTPAGLPAAPSSSADGRVTVTTAAGCGWSAYSDVSWISITGASSGAGNGSLAYHILANTSVARTGNIHVQDTLFTVAQQAAPPPPVQLNAILNGGSYAQGGVAPGEIVAVYGVNIGPTPSVSAGTGDFPKLLGGVQLLFDGVAAPLLYVSATQVNAVVPYGVAGSSTQVQLRYQGVASNTVTTPVQAAAPGLLSLDRSGIGPGAILNQDYSINSAASRAPRGTTVMIYCVGGGVTNPPSTDGAIVALPPPELTQPVSVTIGGVDATVTYHGAAAFLIAGLTQINAVVPTGILPGANVPVVITIGGFQSQSTVTMAVQ